MVDRFVDVFQSGDLDRVIELLSDDAHFRCRPSRSSATGPQPIAEYLRWRRFWGPGLQLVATRANGQPAFGYYVSEPGTSASRLNGLMVLTIVGDRVSTLTRFGGPDIVTRFGLPLWIPGHA